MKKIIQIEPLVPVSLKVVEWKIHNVCNYNCSFCGDEFKDGSKRWYTLEEYKNFVDKIFIEANGEPVWIQLTGGEPTLFPNFIELTKYIKDKGAIVSMISNGSRTLRWWEELRDSNTIDFLTLTYHAEQTSDYKHIAEVLNLFHDRPALAFCMLTYTKNCVDLAIEGSEYLLENTGSILTIKAMQISDYDIEDYLTEEQKALVKKFTWIYGKRFDSKTRSKIPPEYLKRRNIKITYEDSTVENSDAHFILKNKINDFFGFQCDIGMNSMIIEKDQIQRGVCAVGGAKKLTTENLVFHEKPIICDRNTCFCEIDIIAPKRLIENK